MSNPAKGVAAVAVILLVTASFLAGLRVGAPSPAEDDREDPVPAGLPSGLSRSEAERLLMRDLLDRGSEIIEEIIGMEPVLGGTMGFYREENILILNDRWVFVRFEDGHIGGEAVLQFRIRGDRSVQWSLVALAPY